MSLKSQTELISQRRRDADTPHERPSDRQQPAPAGEPKILLVDDKPELLASLGELIAAYGYSAAQSLGGRAALERLARGEQYDVILLDLIMPEVSGHDVLDYLARRGNPSKVIVVSGDSSFEGVKHALTCGAFDFVKKPWEAGELVATLNNALRQRELEQSHQEIEERLRDSEELHRYIVNSSPDLVYMLDRNGCFTFLNDRVETLLGFTKEELLGKHYSILVCEEDMNEARHLFNERRTGDRASHNLELRMRSRRARQASRPFDIHALWMELSAMGMYADTKERTRESFRGTFGTARDISARKEAEQVITFQAYHDLLTHLPNRALLKDRLNLAIAQARRNKRRLAVMFLDLDRFKLVNDTLGHTMGDRLLKAVANRLLGCLRSGDTLSRHGGDEFTLLLPEVRTRDDVAVIATKILDKLAAPFVIDGHELFVGASIGVALYPDAGDTVESLIQSADIAMYHVKGRGKNSFQFFSDEMNHKFSTRLSLERELRNALTQDELRVFYQPQVDLFDGSIVGVEALIRWQHPRHGLVAPEEFLPVAEETGLIVALDEWVQAHAFAEVVNWRSAGLGDLRLSVNMTSHQLGGESFLERFVASLETAGLAPQNLKLEITENTIMQDMELIVPKLKALRDRGVRIAIDDFGTGYSSLSYLKQFPVHTLKIDRSFVADIREEGDASIIDAIVAMAKGLRLDLIAEGVETRTQLKYLRAQGCREVQGYIFSPPVPSVELRDMLRCNPFAATARHDGESAVAAG